LNYFREIQPLPLDHFLRRFFGEVLSQPGLGFHRNLDAGARCRQPDRVGAEIPPGDGAFVRQPGSSPIFDFGREYIAMLQEGVIAGAIFGIMENRKRRGGFWLRPPTPS